MTWPGWILLGMLVLNAFLLICHMAGMGCSEVLGGKKGTWSITFSRYPLQAIIVKGTRREAIIRAEERFMRQSAGEWPGEVFSVEEIQDG